MSQRLDFDVVVVGGGPAGSLAAKAAAEGGARVLLVEEHQEIGSPVQCCGILLTGLGLIGRACPFSEPTKGLSGEQLLERRFNNLGVKFERSLVKNRIYGTHFFWLKGAIDLKTVEKEPVCFILNRGGLDRHLAMDAARSGVEIAVGTRVDGLLRDGAKIRGVSARRNGRRMEVQAEIVIGADGPVSDVGKFAGIETHRDFLTVTQYEMVGVKLESREIKENYDLRPLNLGAPGMAYINPISEDVARVGLGTVAKGVNVSQCFQRLKEVNPVFMERVRGAQVIGRIVDIISTSTFQEETVADNVMLVGDAAAQANPTSGDGIYPAMFCGRIAGEVAAKAIQEGNCSRNRLMEYEERWKASLKPKYEKLLKGRDMLFKIMNKLMEMTPDEVKDLAELFKDEELIAALSTDKPLKALWRIVRHRKAIKPLRGIIRELGVWRLLRRR